MDPVKFMEDGLLKNLSDMVCLSYPVDKTQQKILNFVKYYGQ